LFGPLWEESWSWHVLYDMEPITEVAWKEVFSVGPGAPEHVAAAHVFLTQAPGTATPRERARAILGLAQAGVDAGACALLWPAGRRLLAGPGLPDLCLVDAAKADGVDFATIMTSFEDRGSGPDGRTRLATVGLGQFDLPELCCGVDPARRTEEEAAVTELLDAAVPYLIDLGRPLRPGETIHVGERVWQARGRDDVFQTFVRIDG
jgi:hypothetical protein